LLFSRTLLRHYPSLSNHKISLLRALARKYRTTFADFGIAILWTSQTRFAAPALPLFSALKRSSPVMRGPIGSSSFPCALSCENALWYLLQHGGLFGGGYSFPISRRHRVLVLRLACPLVQSDPGLLGTIMMLLTRSDLTAFAVLPGTELERQTSRDTTTGSDRIMGQRGAVVADSKIRASGTAS
jgi:hypothetical protein